MGFFFRFFVKLRFVNAIKYQYMAKLAVRSFVMRNKDDENQPQKLYQKHMLLKEQFQLESLFLGKRWKELQAFMQSN